MRLLPALFAAALLAGCASTDKPAATVGLVKIPVTDVAKASAFYRETLGLKEEFAVPEFGWAQYETGAVPLCLYVPGKGGGSGVPGHCDSVHLVVGDATAFHDAVAKRCKSPVGAVMKSEDGNVFFEIRDLDGNTIKVMQEERR
ncbi:MAG: VOC family protein [Planctomycetota bacterium]